MKKKRDKLEFRDGEENVYSEDVREDLIESDEISPEEEGFMAGYDEADEESAKGDEGEEPEEGKNESKDESKDEEEP